jgi:putative NADH-flavin reductase
MNAPPGGQARLVIVGATGMFGGHALRYAIDQPAVGAVTAIGRRKLGISHPKLKEVLHQDFADCSALADPLSGQDAAVFCLGTYTGAVLDMQLLQGHRGLHSRVRPGSSYRQPCRGAFL